MLVMNMEAKILIGALLLTGLMVGIGIAVAHDTNENESGSNTMAEIMNEMMGDMHEETLGEMGEMMNNESLIDEMIEHMGGCPMMRNFNSG